MNDLDRQSQRFVACFMLGVFLLNFPVLAVFNVSGSFWGVPILYAYLFVAWALVVALLAYLSTKIGRGEH